MRRTVSESVERLRDDLTAFDATLAAAANKSLGENHSTSFRRWSTRPRAKL